MGASSGLLLHNINLELPQLNTSRALPIYSQFPPDEPNAIFLIGQKRRMALEAQCYEFCILYKFAVLYQASGTFDRQARRRQYPINCAVGIGGSYRIPARSRCSLFRGRPLSLVSPAVLAGRSQVHSRIHSDFDIGFAYFHKAWAIFPDSDAAPPRVPVERRQQRLPRILL